MKIERILAIAIMLLDKKIISANTLAEKFEVTKRTIYRDILTLEYAGFPIMSYPGKNGGYGLIDTFKLDKFTFDDQEKQDILDALQLKAELFSFNDNKSVLEEKIRLLQEEKEHISNLSMGSATLHRPSIEKDTKIKLEKIHQAVSQNKKINIDYVGANGKFTKRTILPIKLKLQNGSWYLEAFCEDKQDMRVFKITRIRKLIVQTTYFNPVGFSFKQEIHKQIIQIKLMFCKNSIGKLYDFYTDSEIEIINDDVYVTFLYDITQDIVPFLLMFKDQVKVIEPQVLIDRHIQAIENMQCIY